MFVLTLYTRREVHAHTTTIVSFNVGKLPRTKLLLSVQGYLEKFAQSSRKKNTVLNHLKKNMNLADIGEFFFLQVFNL